MSKNPRPKKPEFIPARGSRVSKKAAQELGEVILDLTKQGGATPKSLLKAASDPSSPAHKHFDWDDKSAARKHREAQASFYLRSITVVIEEVDPEPVRAFRPVFVDGANERTYEPMGVVIEDVDLFAQVISRATSSLYSWQKQYSQLRRSAQLRGVFIAIDALKEEAPVAAED